MGVFFLNTVYNNIKSLEFEAERCYEEANASNQVLDSLNDYKTVCICMCAVTRQIFSHYYSGPGHLASHDMQMLV